MRLLPSVLLVALAAPATAQPLYEAGISAGYGLSLGTETDMSPARRTSPLSLALTGAVAISDEPELAAFGGVTVETVARNTVGVTGGVRASVPGLPLRLSAGAVWVYAPATRWGAVGSAGACRSRGALALCADVQLTAYVAGSAIDDGHTITEVQLVLGAAFDLGGSR